VSTVVGEVQNASRWYEQQRAGLGHALIGELEEWVALALVRPNAGTMVGATRRGGPHVRWSSGAWRRGCCELEASGPSRALPWPDPQTLLGRDHGHLKSPDPVEFRETRTEVDAREIGHLSELAYMAGRTDKHPANGYIQAQIDSAPEV
jgi:hypothetical protein